MAGEGSQVPPSTSGFAAVPPGGFPEGYGKAAQESLTRGYGWVQPDAEAPPGWQIDPRTNQLLPPGEQPAGQTPNGLLPGYRWIARGTQLPEGWAIDPETDELLPPARNQAMDAPGAPQATAGPWTAAQPAPSGPPPADAPWPTDTPAPQQDPGTPPPQSRQ